MRTGFIIMNSCDECYNMRQPHINKCPQCGKETCHSQVIGLCSVLKCSNCDFDVVGASFNPACWDDTLYSIYVDKPDDSDKLVKLARIVNLRPLELNQRFKDSDGHLEFNYKVRECAETYKKISELEISCSLDQNLMRDYSRILDCPYVSGIE